MVNYFSLGVESRVGLGFEKKRTIHAICNNFVYVYEGLKKVMCCRGRKKTLKIKECVNYVTKMDKHGKEQIMFGSSKNEAWENYLYGNPVSLICTNIDSIMGGKANLWKGGKNRKIGLVDS
jgi:diacylglycerol kinase (ATP)